MYVDPTKQQAEYSMPPKNDDVKEATEALKGMLGLGSSGSPRESESNGDTGTSEAKNQAKAKRNRKRNKKKKPQGVTLETPPKPKQKETSGSANKTKNKKASYQTKRSQSDSSENFAWSAFQSSPDASKLPIPAFSPAPTTKDTLPPPDDEDVPPVNLNLSEDKASSVKTEEKSIEPTQVEIEETNAAPEGTGLNVVSVQPSGPQFPPSLLPMPPPPPPPSYFPPPMPHAYAPPGFVTIRVQLPPVLPANRTLIVANPAGFPVQVHIPQQYAPNQIISVNVPSGPPLPAMPYHHPHHH